jgi:hypothetical protein
MKIWIVDRIRYLFQPEESRWENQWTPRLTSPGRKSSTRLSAKALFWCAMAVVAALMIGKLS